LALLSGSSENKYSRRRPPVITSGKILGVSATTNHAKAMSDGTAGVIRLLPAGWR
jgi:hypothetical protein